MPELSQVPHCVKSTDLFPALSVVIFGLVQPSKIQ